MSHTTLWCLPEWLLLTDRLWVETTARCTTATFLKWGQQDCIVKIFISTRILKVQIQRLHGMKLPNRKFGRTKKGQVALLQVSPASNHKRGNGILSSMCQKLRKLCINPYISIVNQLRTYIHTYIQAQPQTKTPLVPTTPARLWASR